jgi:phage replication O-like protein O
MTEIEEGMVFPGFPEAAQTWDFPNCINGWVNRLSGAEFKVLWYILRHTYGWQKEEDKISYSQFMYGIKKKDGTWLDKGTGLSRDSVNKSIKGLLRKGFIRKFKTRGKMQTNLYKVNILAVPEGNTTSPKIRLVRKTESENRTHNPYI